MLRLPTKITITDCMAVSTSFDARSDVESRTYIYRLIVPKVSKKELEMQKCGQIVGPMVSSKAMFFRNQAWTISFPLDVDRMKIAAQFLTGVHNFAAFAASGCQATSPIKRMERIEIVVEEPSSSTNGVCSDSDRISHHSFLGENDRMISVIVTADSFLYRMVRNIVGVLVRVGRGRMEPEMLKGILSRGKEGREMVKSMAPPQGLYLADVNYCPKRLAEVKLMDSSCVRSGGGSES